MQRVPEIVSPAFDGSSKEYKSFVFTIQDACGVLDIRFSMDGASADGDNCVPTSWSEVMNDWVSYEFVYQDKLGYNEEEKRPKVVFQSSAERNGVLHQVKYILSQWIREAQGQSPDYAALQEDYMQKFYLDRSGTKFKDFFHLQASFHEPEWILCREHLSVYELRQRQYPVSIPKVVDELDMTSVYHFMVTRGSMPQTGIRFELGERDIVNFHEVLEDYFTEVLKAGHVSPNSSGFSDDTDYLK